MDENSNMLFSTMQSASMFYAYHCTSMFVFKQHVIITYVRLTKIHILSSRLINNRAYVTRREFIAQLMRLFVRFHSLVHVN